MTVDLHGLTAEQIALVGRYLRNPQLPRGADLHGLRVEQLDALAGYFRARGVRRQLAAEIAWSELPDARPANVTQAQFDAIIARIVTHATAALHTLETAEGPAGDGARFALSQPLES